VFRVLLPGAPPKVCGTSMIGKSGYRFSLATNAKRLRGDHAKKEVTGP
jgi:hypothetical protein